jgi:hypothetical protein
LESKTEAACAAAVSERAAAVMREAVDFIRI